MKGVLAAWLTAAVTLAGCGSSASSGLLGSTCKADADCSGGQVCRAGACVLEATDASQSADVPLLGSGGATGDASLLGAGGTFAAGGAAGSANGGAFSAGGAPPEGGVVEPPGSEGIGCGPTVCAPGEACCFTPAGLFTQSSYDCVAGSCAIGAVPLDCDGAEECSTGQLCCRTVAVLSGASSYGCRGQCASTEIGCGGPESCPGAQICCELTTTTVLGGQTPVLTECADTCTGTDRFIVCRADSECSGGTSCLDSNLLPGFRVCR